MINASNNKTIILEKDPEFAHTKSDSGTHNYKFLTVPLHVFWEDSTNLWKMRYDAPAKLPPTLEGLSFTKFSQLKNYVEAYYKKRNIVIKEIKENG